MFFKQLKLGGDRNFSYIIGDEVSREAAVVDPAYRPDEILRIADENNFKIKYIINTHGHHDHTGGNQELKDRTDAELIFFDCDIQGRRIRDGEEIYLGETPLTIIHTPGHTHDSICILAEGKLMTGDTLFVGKVGGTSTDRSAKEEYDSLHKKLLVLPDETEVYPGHDYGVRPSSTIGDERSGNPFLIQPDFNSFLYLKNHWTEYKKKHGIS